MLGIWYAIQSCELLVGLAPLLSLTVQDCKTVEMETINEGRKDVKRGHPVKSRMAREVGKTKTKTRDGRYTARTGGSMPVNEMLILVPKTMLTYYKCCVVSMTVYLFTVCHSANYCYYTGWLRFALHPRLDSTPFDTETSYLLLDCPSAPILMRPRSNGSKPACRACRLIRISAHIGSHSVPSKR